MSFSFKERVFCSLWGKIYYTKHWWAGWEILKSKKCSERKLESKPVASANKTRLGADRKLVFLWWIGWNLDLDCPIKNKSRLRLGETASRSMTFFLRLVGWVSHSIGSNSWDPMNCIPPASAVLGIPQARTLEWVAISFSRGLPLIVISCSAGREHAPTSEICLCLKITQKKAFKRKIWTKRDKQKLTDIFQEKLDSHMVTTWGFWWETHLTVVSRSLGKAGKGECSTSLMEKLERGSAPEPGTCR